MDTLSKVRKREEQIIRHISWAEVVILTNKIVEQIKHLPIQNVYGLPRGGLVPATLLSHKLDVPLLMDEKQITKDTLIIDDILDSGETMQMFLSRLTEQPTVVGTLCYKERSVVVPSVFGKEENNKSWIEFPWE